MVGIYWIVHHNLFRNIVDHDRTLLWLNLLFLLSVSFLPYPTEIMGLYGTQFAWTLYAINVVLVGTFLTLVWSYAARSGFTADDVDERTAQLVTIRGLIAPAVFVLSIGVAVVELWLAFFVPILIVPLQWLWVQYYRTDRSDRATNSNGD